MNSPRLRLSAVLTVVAFLAINLGIIRALLGGTEENLLLLALPTVNTLAAVGFVGLRRRHLRPFAAGFVAAGAASLIGFLAWLSDHPWTFIRHVDPLYEALDHVFSRALPSWHTAAVCAVLTVAFAIPHAIVGLASGGLTASGWAMVSRPRRAWRGGT